LLPKLNDDDDDDDDTITVKSTKQFKIHACSVTSVSARPQVRVCSGKLTYNANFSDYSDISYAETTQNSRFCSSQCSVMFS